MKFYIIISQKPDGDLAHMRCSSRATTPQQAADEYANMGRFTPLAWVYMDYNDFDRDCREEYLEDALAAGQRIDKVNGKWVASEGLANKTVEQIYNAPIMAGPRKPKPQVCLEVWREKPTVDTTDYMAAVRDMCKGGPK